MKILKVRLKLWNYEVLGKMDLEVRNAVRELNYLDTLVAIDGVSLALDQTSKRWRLNIRFGKILIIVNPFLSKNRDVFG